MRAVLLFTLLSAAVAFAEPVRVVVFAIESSEPALARLAASATQQLETELGRESRLRVLGQRDLVTALGIERQRQLLGCETSCASEIGHALDAAWLVGGTLAGAGEKLRLDLKVVRLRDALAVWRDGRTFVDAGDLFALTSQLAGEAAAAMVPRTATSSVAPWVVMGGAVALIAGGLTATFVARGEFTGVQQRVTQGILTPEAGLAKTQELNTIIVAGLIGAGVGGAALLGGVLWKLFEPTAAPALSFAVSPGTVHVSLGGSF